MQSPSSSSPISDSLKTTASPSERNTVILSALGLIPPKRRTLSSSSSIENEGPRGQQEVEVELTMAQRASKYENEVRSKLQIVRDDDEQRTHDAAFSSLLFGSSNIASIPQGAVVVEEEEEEEFLYPSLHSPPPPPPSLKPSLNPYATPFSIRPKPPPPQPSSSSTNQIGNLIDLGDDGTTTWETFASGPPPPPPQPPVGLFVPSWLSEATVPQPSSGGAGWWAQAPPFVPSHQRRAAVPISIPASPSTQSFASPSPFSPPPSSPSSIPTSAPSSSSSPPLCEIFVGNLSPATGPSAISSLFSDFGVVRDVRFVKDSSTGIWKGWAIVVFSMEGDVHEARRNAGRAIEHLHGREVHGRRWKVEWARASEEGSGSTRTRTGTAEQRLSFSQVRSEIESSWRKEAQATQTSSKMEPQPRRASTIPIFSPPNDRLAAPNWREVVRAEEESRKPDFLRRRTEDTTSWRNSSLDLPEAPDPVASESSPFDASESPPTETNERYESTGSGWDLGEDTTTSQPEPSNEEEQETGIGWGDESTPFEEEEDERTEEERTPTPVPDPNRGRSDEPTWTWDDTKQEEALKADEEEGFDTEITWDTDPPSTNGHRTTSFDWASEPVPLPRPNHFDEEPTNDAASPSPPPSSRYAPSTTGAGSSSSFGPSSSSPRSSTIFVNNLSFQTGEQGLAATFSLCGRVVRSRIPSNPMTGGSRGFGYVEFEREEQAELALREMDGVLIDGRRIRLELSQPRTDEGSRGAEHDGVGGGAGGRDFEQQQQQSSTEWSYGEGDNLGDGGQPQQQAQQQQPSGYSKYGGGNAWSFTGSRPFETPPRRPNEIVPPPRLAPPPSFNFNQGPPSSFSFSPGPSAATYPNSLPLGRGSGTRRYPPPQSQQSPFAAPPSQPRSYSFSAPPSQPSSRFPPSSFSPSQSNGRDSAPHVGVESSGGGSAGAWGARRLPTAEERAQRKVPFAERKKEPEEESWVEEEGEGEEEKQKEEEEDAGGWNVGRSEMLRRQTPYHSEIPTTPTPTQSFSRSRPSELQPASSSSTITAPSIATGSSSSSSSDPQVVALSQQLQEMQFRLGQAQHQVKIERDGKASTERALRAMRGFPPEQRSDDILEWSGSTGRSTTAPSNQSSSEPPLTPAQSPESKSSRMTPPSTSWASSTPPPSNTSPQTPSQSPSSATNSLPRGKHQRSSAWSTPTPSQHRSNSSTSTARSSSKPSPGAWLSWDDTPNTENDDNLGGGGESLGWDLAEEEQLGPSSNGTRENLFESVDDEDSGGWGVTHSEIVAASASGSFKPQAQTQPTEEQRWGGGGMDEWAREQQQRNTPAATRRGVGGFGDEEEKEQRRWNEGSGFREIVVKKGWQDVGW